MNTPTAAPSPPAITSAVHNLPPLPPLTSYKNSDCSVSNTNSSSGNTGSQSQIAGLNLSVNSNNSSPSPLGHGAANLTSPTHSSVRDRLFGSSEKGSSSSSSSLSSSSSSSSQSWLTALSGQTHGQKRPLPAHSNPPPSKRPLVEKVASDSPSSSNSNMSPLVDLDQLCSILDSDRDRNNEEIASVLPFPTDFPLTMTASSQNSRNIFNVSPSDIISLD